MQKFKRYLVIFGIFFILLLGGALAFVMYGSYAEGFRVGTVAKMSKKGLLFKTWEGELTQGFLDSNPADGAASGVATRIWYFTVDGDPVVLGDIDKAIEQGHKVKMFYKEKFTSLPWVGETRHIVFKVEQVQ